MNLYFIHTLVIKNKLYIAKRNCGFSENAIVIEKIGWKLKVTRLKK